MRVTHGSNSADDHLEHTPYTNRLSAYGLALPRRATNDGIAGPRSVWLTCTDDLLAPAMSRLEQSGAAIVLRIHGSFSKMLDIRKRDISSRLDGAVALSYVDRLVVAGHSMCTCFLGGDPPDWQEHGERSIQNLIRRTAHWQRWNRRSRELLQYQIAALQCRPSVAKAIQGRALTVCGMWYVRESGLWLRYTEQDGWTETVCFA